MVYECKTCNFETSIKTHFGRHMQTKKHIELCGNVAPEVQIAHNNIAELEKDNEIEELKKRILELENQLKIKDAVIECKDQTIEILKNLHSQPVVQPAPVALKKKKTEVVESEDEEEKTKSKSIEKDAKDIELLQSKLKYMSNSEGLELLQKGGKYSLHVKSWMANEMTKLLCEGEPQPIQCEEGEEAVKEFKYEGKCYLLAVDGVVYDKNSQEEIGFYDGKKIKFN